ncbi:MAG: exodeoxyribonuclease VII small subunit [Peptococcaceae bacterium]|nr:exodeoxyribonuclease VII small subunit [Peptococcaceae bacterium]
MEQQQSYEKALERLEQVIAELDTGELPLEASIQLFQDGLEMIKICQAKLNDAEGKIRQLTDNGFVEMGE